MIQLAESAANLQQDFSYWLKRILLAQGQALHDTDRCGWKPDNPGAYEREQRPLVLWIELLSRGNERLSSG